MQKQRPNRFALMLSDGEVEAIENYRFAHRVGSRASAVRHLIHTGLAAKNKSPATAATVPGSELNPTPARNEADEHLIA